MVGWNDITRPTMIIRGNNTPSTLSSSSFTSTKHLFTIMGQTKSSNIYTFAETEVHDVFFDLNRTENFNSGTLLTNQRAVYIGAPTYAFPGGAQTITTAATVAI